MPSANDQPIDLRRLRHRLRNRLARTPARHHGVVLDHAARRTGFCVQQGAGLADRQDDQGDRGEAREAEDELSAITSRAAGTQRGTQASPAFATGDAVEGSYFDSVILAARNWLSAFMAICC